MKLFPVIKLKNKYSVQKSEYPDEEGTHVLWYESETLSGSGYRRIYKGTYQECLKMKKEIENGRNNRNVKSIERR